MMFWMAYGSASGGLVRQRVSLHAWVAIRPPRIWCYTRRPLFLKHEPALSLITNGSMDWTDGPSSRESGTSRIFERLLRPPDGSCWRSEKAMSRSPQGMYNRQSAVR